MATITSPLPDTMLLQLGLIRVICTKRKRKLEKRGSQCKWSEELNTWVWFPLRIGPLAKFASASLLPRDVFDFEAAAAERKMLESWKDPVIYARP